MILRGRLGTGDGGRWGDGDGDGRRWDADKIGIFTVTFRKKIFSIFFRKGVHHEFICKITNFSLKSVKQKQNHQDKLHSYKLLYSISLNFLRKL